MTTIDRPSEIHYQNLLAELLRVSRVHSLRHPEAMHFGSHNAPALVIRCHTPAQVDKYIYALGFPNGGKWSMNGSIIYQATDYIDGVPVCVWADNERGRE